MPIVSVRELFILYHCTLHTVKGMGVLKNSYVCIWTFIMHQKVSSISILKNIVKLDTRKSSLYKIHSNADQIRNSSQCTTQLIKMKRPKATRKFKANWCHHWCCVWTNLDDQAAELSYREDVGSGNWGSWNWCRHEFSNSVDSITREKHSEKLNIPATVNSMKISVLRPLLRERINVLKSAI